MYLRYYDTRFGDIYEIFIDDQTGDFQHAARSFDRIGLNPMFYDSLSQIPKVQRNAIEEHINKEWNKSRKGIST